MVITGTWGSEPVVLTIRPGCLIVSVGDPQQASVISADLEGRLWTAFLDGISYRRGLNGRVMARWRDSAGQRQRRWLPAAEGLAIEEKARQIVSGLEEALDLGQASLRTPLPHAARDALRRTATFDRERSLDDVQRYHAIYRPIGILPPDRYLAVVLQMTEGCSFNTCTFCSFYRGRPFRIKSPAELRDHAEGVRRFLGKGLSLRRSIFLGDANALVIPLPRLLPLLDAVHEVFDVAGLGGMSAFLDGFSGEKKSAADYAQIKARGVTAIYVGLESGSEALLNFLHKPGTAADAVAAVRAMKAGGLQVGIIVLLGAGGHRYADTHISETAAALNAMELGAGDILYFSELVISKDLPYAQEAARAGVQPLSTPECRAQQEAIVRQLAFRGPGAPRISRYDIREFVY